MRSSLTVIGWFREPFAGDLPVPLLHVASWTKRILFRLMILDDSRGQTKKYQNYHKLSLFRILLDKKRSARLKNLL